MRILTIPIASRLLNSPAQTSHGQKEHRSWCVNRNTKQQQVECHQHHSMAGLILPHTSVKHQQCLWNMQQRKTKQNRNACNNLLLLDSNIQPGATQYMIRICTQGLGAVFSPAPSLPCWRHFPHPCSRNVPHLHPQIHHPEPRGYPLLVAFGAPHRLEPSLGNKIILSLYMSTGGWNLSQCLWH